MSHKLQFVFMADRETHRRLAAGEPFENFPDKWVDLQKLEDDAAKFGKKCLAGNATLDDFALWYESIPPVVRQNLSEVSQGEIFNSEYLPIIKFLCRFLYGKVRTSEESVDAAYLRLLRCHVGINLDFVRVASSWLNISRHVSLDCPLAKDALSVHDEHLSGALRITGKAEEISPCLPERLAIAGKHEPRFFRTLKRIFSKERDIRLEKFLIDIQIGILRPLLLTYWLQLSPSSQGIGLADFTYQAIVEFCCGLQNASTDKEFNVESIRNAIRRYPLQLIRRPAIVTACAVNTAERNISMVRQGSRLTVPFP